MTPSRVCNLAVVGLSTQQSGIVLAICWASLAGMTLGIWIVTGQNRWGWFFLMSLIAAVFFGVPAVVGAGGDPTP